MFFLILPIGQQKSAAAFLYAAALEIRPVDLFTLLPALQQYKYKPCHNKRQSLRKRKNIRLQSRASSCLLLLSGIWLNRSTDV